MKYEARDSCICLVFAVETWKYSAECLREVARYAGTLGVNIGLEPVNRYETYLVNTCGQALKLKEMIGEPNVKIHLDTYHMNLVGLLLFYILFGF